MKRVLVLLAGLATALLLLEFSLRTLGRLDDRARRESGAALSDTDAGLRPQLGAGAKKESFYSFREGAQDEHLNERGYALVAKLLFDTLTGNRLVP